MTEKAEGSLLREELILRDRLAIYRTVLANERTLLAYVRTALAAIITGMSFIEFLEGPFTTVAGWFSVVAGAALLLFGLWRFRSIQRRIKVTRGEGPPHTQPD